MPRILYKPRLFFRTDVSPRFLHTLADLVADGIVSGLPRRFLHTVTHLAFTIVMLWSFAVTMSAQVKVVVDRNTGTSATGEFKFQRVPSPVKDNAAAKAKLSLVVGKQDPNGGSVNALIDGALPTDQDEPGANFFFDAGTDGGRILMDLGVAMEIAQVNTYSWHTDTRGPQVYNLYASDGADPKFNLEPDAKTDPARCGWSLVAQVDTRPRQGGSGGQYGVSISDSRGTLGKFRYLLFDSVPTEIDDPWGNTFYSEVDVVAKN
jgi:hypothetical protein